MRERERHRSSETSRDEEFSAARATQLTRRRAPGDDARVTAPRTLADVDWTRWSGVACTLVFVVRGGEVLLIRKLRGLGAGKVNGPGGKIDPGESPLAGAAREVQEEVCAAPLGLTPAGRARFQFADGYATDVHVFRASGLAGEPKATPEADPFWVPVAQIPYAEMWEDDALWLPHLLAGRAFSGRFLFDEDKLLDWAIEIGG
jgi:8-oxo-dGTP diphosphatase